MAALAEARFGAGRDKRSVFYVTVGTGVGGGLVLGGTLYGSDRPAIAEIGHLRPGLDATEPSQTVESLASGPGIEASIRTALAAAPGDDPHAARLLSALRGRFPAAHREGRRRGSGRRQHAGRRGDGSRVPRTRLGHRAGYHVHGRRSGDRGRRRVAGGRSPLFRAACVATLTLTSFDRFAIRTKSSPRAWARRSWCTEPWPWRPIAPSCGVRERFPAAEVPQATAD